MASGTTETGMTATPVTVSAAPAKGSRSIDVTRPSSPSASWRARIESGSFLRGQRTRQRIGRLITGAHVILFTPESEALRAVFRDALGWKHVDAGNGELIFLCDDITRTIEELRAKGIEVRGEPEDRGWGIATTMVLPGGVDVTLYEPRHPVAMDS